MKADLIVLVPSRGRPDGLERLIGACHRTCQAATALFFAFDRDDPQLTANLQVARSAPRSTRFVVGPRDTLSGWTNAMARMCMGEAGALASLGDDHVPQTTGWDSRLLEAIGTSGGTGIAYGNDLLQGENLPTAPVISADIVAALEWFCQPSLMHMYVDNVWKILGTEAACLHYLKDVIVEHQHVSTGKTRPDDTSQSVAQSWGPDGAAFRKWLSEDMARDVRTVKGLMQGAA